MLRLAWPTSASACPRTHCGTALPRIFWSRISTSASSRPCSERRHTAHEHPCEGRIPYRFHPRYGETVLVTRRLERSGVEFVVVRQPDGSLACLPAWMTQDATAQFVISEEPCFSLDILRSLRIAGDALLGCLSSE